MSSPSFLGPSPWKAANTIINYNNNFKSGLSKNHLLFRFKSSRAAAATLNYDESDDDEDSNNNNNNVGLDTRYGSPMVNAAAMSQRTSSDQPPEPWMINLGRNNDNEWLLNPRNPEEWFTGVAPMNQCPGKCSTERVGASSFAGRLMTHISGVNKTNNTVVPWQSHIVHASCYLRYGRVRSDSLAPFA